MKNLSIIVNNDVGLHARPAASFVKTAQKFQSEITVEKDDKNANGKSLISILALGVGSGDHICITATGEDEELAIDEMKKLIENNFSEYQ